MAQNTITTKLLLNTNQFQSSMSKAASKAQQFGQKMFRVGRDLSASLTLPLALAARNVIKTASAFELAQTKIAALSGSSKIFKDMSDSARKLGASTIFTAEEISNLQLNLKKLGKSRKEILSLQESVLKFAQAMDTDLAEAGSFVVQTLNRFSETLEKVGSTTEQAAYVTDLFAAAAANTAVDAEKLRSALNYVGSEAAAAGYDLEQTTAILGIMADRGFDASRGGTAFRRILAQLAKEGYTAEESISQLFDSTASYAEELASFGLRGAGPKAALGGLRVEYQLLLETLQNSDGFLDDVADTLDNTLYASLRKVASAANELSISFGGDLSKPLRNFLALITDLIKKFSSAPPLFKKVVVGLAGLLALLGPIALGIGALTLAFGALSTVLIANPIFAALAGLIALGVAIASTAYDTDQLAVSYRQSALSLQKYNGISSVAIKKAKLQNEEVKDAERLLKRQAAQQRRVNNLQNNLASYRAADKAANREASVNTKKTEKAYTRAVEILKEQNDELDKILGKAREIQETIDNQGANRKSSFLSFFPTELTAEDERKAKAAAAAAAQKAADIADEARRIALGNRLYGDGSETYAEYFGPPTDMATPRYWEYVAQKTREYGDELKNIQYISEGFDENFDKEDGIDWAKKGEQVIEYRDQIKKAFEENSRTILDWAVNVGDVLSRTFFDAATGVKSLAESIKDNLLDALQKLIAKIVALTIAWGILTLISGGSSALAGLAGNALKGAGGGSLGGFIGSGFGLDSVVKNQQVTVNGSLSGTDLILTNQRAGSALDRIYG